MIIAFQVILLLVILISFIGVIAEEKHKGLKNDMLYVCIISILSMLAMVILL